MCEPTTIMMGVQMAVAATSFIGKQQQAKAQERALMADNEQQQKTMLTQQWQARAQAGEQMSNRAKEAMQERGRLAVVAAESGLAGNSQDRLFNSSAFNEGQDITSIQRNARNTQQQSEQQKQSIRTQTQGRINTFERPSMLGTGLQIAGAYADYKSKPGVK